MMVPAGPPGAPAPPPQDLPAQDITSGQETSPGQPARTVQATDGPLPPELLASPAMVEACASHDIGAIFRLAKRHAGIYHSRMARLCQMTPSRVAEYANEKARVKQQHVIERVADGLRIPGHMFGLAPRAWESPAPVVVPPRTPSEPQDLKDAVAALGTSGGPEMIEAYARAALGRGPAAGHAAASLGRVVELSLEITLDIDANGDAAVRFLHTLFNMSPTPLSRITREMWFEKVSGPLLVEPVRGDGPHKVAVQRLHDAKALIKFGCQISPPVPQGGTVEVEYVCRGGHFAESLYWRQEIHRPVNVFSLRINHASPHRLASCHAVVQLPDGSEQTSTDGILWDDDDGISIALTREHLQPNQAVTLVWHLDR